MLNPNTAGTKQSMQAHNGDQNQSNTNAFSKLTGNQQASKADAAKASSGANANSSHPNNNTPIAQKTNKKRDREEAFGGKIEEPSIEEIL